MVQPGIGGAGEADDPLSPRVGQTSRRRAAPIAMGQGGRPAAAVGPAQPPHVAVREPQEPGGVCHLEFSPIQSVQDKDTSLLTLRQDDLPHSARGLPPGQGRTFSLSS